MSHSLFDPILDPGIRNPHFFEGRLLTADALRDDQKAHRLRQQMLGRAIGAGVVEGLAVTAQPAGTDGVRKTVTIGKGVAINGEGAVLALGKDLTADIVPPVGRPQASAGLFERCEDAPPAPTLPIGVGLYLLVMSPATGYRERAPKSGLGTEGTIVGCGDRYAVEGVRFRVEPLLPSLLAGGDAAVEAELTALLQATTDPMKRSVLRNLVSHLCFGTRETAGFAVDPFARRGGAAALLRYGVLDRMHELKRLTACDVPLALLLWNPSGIAFLDLWAVRRRPVPVVRSTDWPLVAGGRAAAEGEARFLQFQAHLLDLLGEVTTPTSLKARDYFRYLPPAGLLPIAGPEPQGVSATTFFQNLTVRYPRPPRFDAGDGPIVLEGARLPALLRDAVHYPGIDVAGREAVWLYRVRENRMAIDAQAGAARGLVVFATGQMPYYASPRFDVARWDYSNYSSALLGPGAL